ncbi:MAG: sigma-70 family RNA polymerase sigma factor [Clostridia bacterium]|nr:sigma-70 family RNA polymerase sigma factor [Clostridia bacterium]
MNAILPQRNADADIRAFEDWVTPYEDGVYRLCLHMTGDREDAEDCVQETFIKAYRGMAGFRGEAKPSTWLYRIAYRACLDLLARRKPYTALEALPEEGGLIAGTDPGPYASLEKSERFALLKRALNSLPDTHRGILILKIQGLDYRAIAKVTGLPEGTVKSRLNRARENLRRALLTDRELFEDTAVQVFDKEG